MIAKKQRSKKRSDASSERQPDEIVLFLDRNLGKHVIAEALRDTGHRVEIHDDHLPVATPDSDPLPANCAIYSSGVFRPAIMMFDLQKKRTYKLEN